MGVSRHRKNHKKKVQVYKNNVLIAKKKEKEELIRKFTEQMQLANEQTRHKDSELVTDSGIEVDLNSDFSDFSFEEGDSNVVDLSNFETVVEEKTLDEVQEVVVEETIEAPVKVKKPRKAKKVVEAETLPQSENLE